MVFMCLTYRILSKNGQSLDNYMKVTLSLLFFSLIFANFEIFDLLSNDSKVLEIFHVWISGYPQQICEKLAIFVDIARLATITATMYNRKDKIRTIHWFLASQIVLIIILVTVLFYVDFKLVNDKDNLSLDQTNELKIVSKVSRCLFTIQSNLGIIVAYLTIYFYLRSFYH